MPPTPADPGDPAPLAPPSAPAPPRLSVAEFLARHNGGNPYELVRGVPTEIPRTGTEHGVVCASVAILLGDFVKANDLGRVACNDTFVQTGPDTVRGADVLYYSWERLPRERPVPDGVHERPPDLVVEVKSPGDTWGELLTRMSEYLRADVRVVVVVDPGKSTVSIYRSDDHGTLRVGDILTLPDVLPGLAVPVARLFA